MIGGLPATDQSSGSCFQLRIKKSPADNPGTPSKCACSQQVDSYRFVEFPYLLVSALIVEPVAYFRVNFSRIVPVETAKGLAVIEIDSTIRHIQRMQRCGEFLAEILAQGKIEGCVLRQVVSRIRLCRKGVAETGAVVDVC